MQHHRPGLSASKSTDRLRIGSTMAVSLRTPRFHRPGMKPTGGTGHSEKVRLDQPRLCMVVTSFTWELLID
jgi:hypothetical protein